MTDGSAWERPPTSPAPAPHESAVSNDVHTNDVHTNDLHTIGKARGPVELVGLLLVIGAATIELGQGIAANEFTFNESAGDFFASMAIWQIIADLFVTLGVILCVAPRLFFRSGPGSPRGVATSGVVVGLVVALAAVVLSIGALFVTIARASDDEIGVGAGGWIAQLGAVLIALAVLGLAYSALAILQASGNNDPV